ncbi:unnamed protein product [Urochloa humidicola]
MVVSLSKGPEYVSPPPSSISNPSGRPIEVDDITQLRGGGRSEPVALDFCLKELAPSEVRVQACTASRQRRQWPVDSLTPVSVAWRSSAMGTRTRIMAPRFSLARPAHLVAPASVTMLDSRPPFHDSTRDLLDLTADRLDSTPDRLDSTTR